MTTADTWKAIQSHVGVTADGSPGPNTARAIADALGIDTSHEDEHVVNASSFADPQDVAAFRKCKAQGGTDQACFAVGDNGIGFRGMDCTDDSKAICALPPEDWRLRWGDAQTANGKPVIVTWNGITVEGVMGDTMPSKLHITNGAGIDLNMGFAKAFDVWPPFMLKNVTWKWGKVAEPPLA